MKPRAQIRGVSLIETCAVLALVGVLAAAAVPSHREARLRKTVEGAAAELAAQLQYARSEARARSIPVRMSLYGSMQTTSCALVHTGSPDECQCASAAAASCSGDAQLLRILALDAGQGVSLQSNVGSMLFDPLHGTTSPSGTWRVVSTGAGSVHHVVNILGRVRTCSPAPSLSGYRSC